MYMYICLFLSLFIYIYIFHIPIPRVVGQKHNICTKNIPGKCPDGKNWPVLLHSQAAPSSIPLCWFRPQLWQMSSLVKSCCVFVGLCKPNEVMIVLTPYGDFGVQGRGWDEVVTKSEHVHETRERQGNACRFPPFSGVCHHADPPWCTARTTLRRWNGLPFLQFFFPAVLEDCHWHRFQQASEPFWCAFCLQAWLGHRSGIPDRLLGGVKDVKPKRQEAVANLETTPLRSFVDVPFASL